MSTVIAVVTAIGGTAGLGALVRSAAIWRVIAWSMQNGRTKEDREHARAIVRLLTPTLWGQRGEVSEPAATSAIGEASPTTTPGATSTT